MRRTHRLFEAVLRLYPPAFQREFGDEMRAFVHARAAEPRYPRRYGIVRLWGHLIVNGVIGAVRVHIDGRARRQPAAGHRVAVPSALLPDVEPPEDTMVTLVQDTRYTLRTLRRRPAYTVVSAVTLALGIGATAAIFGVVDGMLFRPLRYPNPEQIVVVTMTRGTSLREPVAYPDFIDWREQSRSFLSEGLWRRQFAADPAIIGRPVILNGQPFEVIGIVPSTFNFFAGTDVWLPIAYYPNNSGLTRKDHSMTVIGRLKPEVTIEAAAADMRAAGARLAQQYPSENSGFGTHVESLHTLLRSFPST